MSSARFPPPANDPRFPRDRSPPKGPERRPQNSYNESLLASRAIEPAIRSNEPYSTRREPPRGPKALVDGPRGGYIPRARGAYLGRGDGRGRGDIRDRDFRDGRDDPPFSRRGRGQDWPPRDRFDDRPQRSPPPGRDRSRSPLSREFRDTRDGPPSAGPSVSEFPLRGRGGYRGRARGNYDHSERGRSLNQDEPESYKARSRSRERDWERLVRDEISRKEREDKDDRSRRDQPTYRPDSRNSGGAPKTPLTSRSTSTTSIQPANYERLTQGYRDSREPVSEYDRKLPGQENLATGYNAYKDLEQSNMPFKRTDSDRYESRNSSPPPQAPPVPAFGSIPPRALPPSQDAPTRLKPTKDDTPPIHPSRLSLLDPAREAPSAPRAHILGNAPTVPKGRQSLDRDSGDISRVQSTVSDRSKRFDSSHELDGFYPQASALTSETPTSCSDSAQPSVKKAVEEQGRNGNLPLTVGSRAPTGDVTSLISSSRIPTGPRADRASQSSRPLIQPSIRGPANRGPPINPRGGGRQPNTLTWTNPNLNRAAPRGPSIMNTVPTKKDYIGDDKYRRVLPNLDTAETSMDPRISPQRRSFTTSGAYHREHPTESARQNLQDTPMGNTAVDDHGDGELPTAVSGVGTAEEESDEDGLEDADMDFDERDFQEAEKKFEREMQGLEARRPSTPRSNPLILDLLEELDALASALEEKIKDGSADETIKVESAALGLPSPRAEDDDDRMNRDFEKGSALTLRQRPPTPPIENLPFLASGPLTPTSFMEGLEEDPNEYEEIRRILEERLATQEADIDIENNEMREAFKRQYKAWRTRVEDIEDAKRAQRVVEASPPPDSGLLIAQLTPAAGRRGRAHATELDIQKILKESEESAARDEQRRREREDRAYEPPETFNDQREAVVPDMLDRYEAESSIFPDNNNFVPPEQALTAFAFLPKPDNFTKEEHEAFVMEYVQNPKRFGTIARSEKLASRNYQDCVQHYYSTKLHCSYKTLEANFWKSARGKKVARRRGAANALGFGNDGHVDESQVLPLTDAGRPRRAAAPNFGATEATDTEQPTAVTTPARRGQAGIMNAEKTSAKRPKTTGQKPGRKPKAQLLAPQPGPSPAPSPQKNDAPAFRIEPPVVPPEQFKHPDPDLEGAQALAGLNGQPFPVVSVRAVDAWAPPVLPPVAPARATSEGFHQPPMEPAVTHHGTEPPIPINSYWNVAETQDLKNYLAYYGQDWQAIAVNIPAKTHTMVKNRFNKLVKEGDSNLEQIATRADEKLKRGEPMGPKPAPTPVSSKRRYDMTSRSDPRPLAPLGESTELGRSSPSLRPKTSNQPVPRLGQAPQTLATLAQAEQGAAALSSQMLSQGPANPANRVDLQSRSQNPPQVQGPRLGMFQESRPRPSQNTVISLDAPPERPPPLQHRGLPQRDQQMMERQRQVDMGMEAQVHQQNQAQQIAAQQQIKRERDLAMMSMQNLDRERQVRPFEPATFAPSIQLDEASRELIVRQEQKKQLEREQREQRELEQQQLQHQHLQQQQQQQQQQKQQQQQQQQQSQQQQQQQQQSQQQQQQQQQHQQQQQSHRQQPATTESTSSVHRYPSNLIEFRYQHAQSRSPATANLQMPMSPPPHVRPSSVPAPTSAQPPPAPSQPKKKSNIMNLLNDDSEDTKPTRKMSESRPVATPPPQQRQQPLQYQPEQSIDQMLHRREAPADSLQHAQPHHRSQQSQPQPQQPSLSREASRDWPSTTLHRQSMYEQIPSFQSPPAPSQPQPPSFIPSTARHSFQSTQRDHAPSPPLNHHSRTSSYTSQHKHRSSVPSAPIEQSLRPSPYANLNPNQPSHQHHNAPQHQHHQAQQQQEAILQLQQQQQQHAQQRQRQDDLRLREQQETARLHHQQQQQPLPGLSEYRPRSTVNEDFQARTTAARHEGERALRQQDSFRFKLDQQLELRRVHERQDAAVRHHQDVPLRRQQEEELLMRQQDRDDPRVREEAGGRARYGPFYDQQGSGYAPPPPPPQRDNPLPPPPPPPPTAGVQGRGLGGGYEERR